MGKLLQLARHPAGRIGMALGFAAGFVAAFLYGAGKMFLFVSAVVFWQHISRFCIHISYLVKTSKRKARGAL